MLNVAYTWINKSYSKYFMISFVFCLAHFKNVVMIITYKHIVIVS